MGEGLGGGRGGPGWYNYDSPGLSKIWIEMTIPSPEQQLFAASPVLSARMIDSVIQRCQALGPQGVRWHYEHGLVLKAVEQAWRVTGEARYGRVIQDYLEALIDPDGGIKT